MFLLSKMSERVVADPRPKSSFNKFMTSSKNPDYYSSELIR